MIFLFISFRLLMENSIPLASTSAVLSERAVVFAGYVCSQGVSVAVLHLFAVLRSQTLQQLLAECQSEFVRRLCLGLSGDLLPPEAGRPPSVPLTLLSDLGGTLAELQRRLTAAYRAHAALWTAEPEPVPTAAPPAAAGLQRLYVGVHSVCLQAQVVALRARALEEALSAEDGDGAAEEDAEQQRELFARLRRELTEIQQRLDSGQLFCEQTQLQLSRLEGGGGPEEQKPAPSPPTAAVPAPVLLTDLPEPELVDQFFEAVVEGGSAAGGDSEDELLSREERLRRRLERDRARELLKELNVALTGKRQEWRVREAVAKGEPVPPPPQPSGQAAGPEGSDAGSPREGADPYKVNKADLYDFSGSEDEGHGAERWRPSGTTSKRGPPPDVTDGYRVDKHELYRFSDSEGEAEPAGPLVLPPAGDLTHLLSVQRRARPPSRRPPSRPGSTVGTPRGQTQTSPGQGSTDPASSGGVSPLTAAADRSPPSSTAAPLTACPEDPAVPATPPVPSPVPAVPSPPGDPPVPLIGAARYRATALGLPSRQGFPAEMAAQAAAPGHPPPSAAARGGDIRRRWLRRRRRGRLSSWRSATAAV